MCLQVYDCSSASGFWKLVEMNGIMNTEKYHHISDPQCSTTGKASDWEWCHCVAMTQTVQMQYAYLHRKTYNASLSVMDGAPHSLNLSVTEFQACENCTNSIFALHTVFSGGICMCFNKSLYPFPIFLGNGR